MEIIGIFLENVHIFHVQEGKEERVEKKKIIIEWVGKETTQEESWKPKEMEHLKIENCRTVN